VDSGYKMSTRLVSMTGRGSMSDHGEPADRVGQLTTRLTADCHGLQQ